MEHPVGVEPTRPSFGGPGPVHLADAKGPGTRYILATTPFDGARLWSFTDHSVFAMSENNLNGLSGTPRGAVLAMEGEKGFEPLDPQFVAAGAHPVASPKRRSPGVLSEAGASFGRLEFQLPHKASGVPIFVPAPHVALRDTRTRHDHGGRLVHHGDGEEGRHRRRGSSCSVQRLEPRRVWGEVSTRMYEKVGEARLKAMMCER